MSRQFTQYTITFIDVYESVSDLFDNIKLDTESQTTNFINMIKSMFYNYEISSETIPLFKLNLERTFNVTKQYYQEKLNIYENNIIEFDKLIKNVQETSEIDLPNKNTNIEYPTKKVQVSNLSYDSLILQRDDLIASVKNIYHDFCLEFLPCFNQIFYVGNGGVE